MPEGGAHGLPAWGSSHPWVDAESPPHEEHVGKIGFNSYRPTLTDLICSVEKDSEALSKFSLNYC